MTNSKLFRETVDSLGLKLLYVASKMGLTYAGLKKKIENESEFKASEINAFCKITNINVSLRDKIFFANKMN